jgi:ATP-dependent DNA helicase DinG
LVQAKDSLLLTSAEILGPAGPLAARLAGFQPRQGQQELATRVETALAHHGIFVGESGTGTGKTFAYLVPALLSGKKLLISSGTKHLQEQIFERDLPLVRELLQIPVSAALLKGRANYLCLHRLQRSDGERHIDERYLQRIRTWARHTRHGDLSEVSDVPEDAAIWPLVTSTAENCLGSSCAHYHECFVNRARREALDADVVVINHHLFFADLALREEGFGELLPGVEAVIFDEAHQLPEIASGFFGVSIGSHQLTGLCRDSIAEDLRERSELPQLQVQTAEVEKATADLRLTMGVEPRRGPWAAMVELGTVNAAVAELRQKLSALAATLELAAVRGPGLGNCSRRAAELLDRLLTVTETAPPEYLCWFETTVRGFVLHLTALDIAASFHQHLSSDKAWVFASATLTISNRFDHYCAQLGLEHADTARWDSPFDYRARTLLYIPEGLPNPLAPEYTLRVVEAAIPVLRASRGRAFLLFTSHRALRQAADALAGTLDYPLLVQGSAPRTELLERFRAAGDAVLLGTGSFWEGVDVRGEALSCVIIDKLPFASPEDPILRARCQALEQAGRNPFLEYQLPAAVIALKQGVGRLIRDERDRGVLVLCDPRLLAKGYGKVFLESLPPIPLTRDVGDVERFFAQSADPTANKKGG